MSEKKYYVKDLLTGEGAWGGKDIFGVVCGSHLKPTIFTKSELAEIMDSALYKQTDSLPFEWLYSFESLKEKLGWEFNETIDKWEYTNPLIELVPVEDIV